MNPGTSVQAFEIDRSGARANETVDFLLATHRSNPIPDDGNGRRDPVLRIHRDHLAAAQDEIRGLLWTLSQRPDDEDGDRHRKRYERHHMASTNVHEALWNSFYITHP